MEDEFLDAAESGNLPEVKWLMAKGCPANTKNERGHNALHYAAAGGHVDVIKYLAPRMESMLHSTDDYGYNMVTWAAQEGHADVVKLVVEHYNLDPAACDKYGWTPVLRAALGGHNSIIELLVDQYHCSLTDTDNRGHNALHKAAMGGHVDTIKYLAPRMESMLHSTDDYGYNMVTWAAQKGHADMVKLVVEQYNLDPAARDKDGMTPVLQAALGGHNSIIELLVDQYHCSLTDVTNKGDNALHCAAEGGHVDTIKYLAPRMESLLHSTDDRGYNMIHYGAQQGHADVVKLVVEHYKLDPAARDKNGRTPVVLASRNGHSDLVDVLVGQYGCSMSDEEGLQHAFLGAAGKGDLDRIKDLIGQGCSVNARDQDGYNALHYAADGGHVDTIRYLAPKMDSLLHSATNHGHTMILLAAGEGHNEVIRLAIEEYKLELTACDVDGDTALQLAAEGGHVSTIQYLAPMMESMIHYANYDGYTMLHHAAWKGHPQVVQLVVDEYHLDPTARVKDGRNALHLAAKGGHVSTIRCLAPRMEALLNSTDREGYTMLHWAAQEGQTEVVRLALEEYHVDVTAVDKDGRNALHLAAKGGHVGTIKCLAPKMEALLHSTDHKGFTMLHWAAQEGHAAAVQLVLNEYKLDPTACDKRETESGETPLHKAVNRNHLYVAQLLIRKGALAAIKDPGPLEEAITRGDLSTAKKLLGITESKTESGHNLHKFERQYSKAVETSASVTLQITKCTTIGPPRIGKSCFKNLLIGVEWDEKEGTASTDIMEAPEWVECYSVEKEGSEQLWQLLPPEQQHGGLLKAVNKLASSSAQPKATRIAAPNVPSPHSSTEMTFGPHKELTDGQHEETSSRQDEESTDGPHKEMTDGQPDLESTDTTPTDAPRKTSSATLATTEPSTAKGPATFWQALKDLSCAYNREGLERLLKDEEGKVLGETRLIHFIDTGGQAIYHDVHPVLITSPSIYLVVFSLLDFFQQKSKEDQLEYFRSELIQRPLRSIYTFGTKRTEEKDHLELQPQAPKIFIVGTHLDKIPPGDVRKDFLANLHEMISSEIGTKPYRQFVQYDIHGKAFWAVDNTLAGKKQDDGVRQYVSTLRTMVQDKSMEMSVRVPLTWMLLKMVMDGKGERYCRYSDLLKEAHDRGYVKEKEDLDTMLRLFHILGLLYHKVPEGYKKEDSLVFLDPDSLYSATSYFLMAAKEEIEGSCGGTRANDPQIQPAKDDIGHVAADARQQEPDSKIVQQRGVIRRMEDNFESIRHAMERELKKVDNVMTKLDLEPAATTAELLRDLHAELEDIGRGYMSAHKITKDASTLQDKRQMFIGRLVHSLASAVASVLPKSGAEGDIHHIRKEIEKAKKNIQARYESRSIRSNDMDQFLSILQELRIIAKLSDSDAYIVPAALPTLSQPLEFDGSADPILVTVVSQAMMRVCYLPSGLFCCLISELVTVLGWTMIPQGRTHVVFQPREKLTGRVHMTEHESYIEIKMESESPLQELSKTCQEVREQIHKCITHVFNTLYSGSTNTAGSKFKESVVWGFQCQAHPSVKSHIAAFQKDEFEYCAKCLIQSSCVQEVEPEELAWFTSELDLD